MVNAKASTRSQALSYVVGQSRAYLHTLDAQKAELRLEGNFAEVIAELEEAEEAVQRLNHLATRALKNYED